MHELSQLVYIARRDRRRLPVNRATPRQESQIRDLVREQGTALDRTYVRLQRGYIAQAIAAAQDARRTGPPSFLRWIDGLLRRYQAERAAATL